MSEFNALRDMVNWLYLALGLVGLATGRYLLRTARKILFRIVAIGVFFAVLAVAACSGALL